MRNIIENYGRDAGKIWDTLNTYGTLKESKLLKTTKLREDDFYAAIGWLAKENKICKHGTSYSLGDTNLNTKIGRDAGKIWKALDTWGEVEAFFIPKLAKVKENDAYCALGWLAKEGKLKAKKTKPKKPQLKFKLYNP